MNEFSCRARHDEKLTQTSMDDLPEELIRLILVQALGGSEEGERTQRSAPISCIAKRFANASMTCKEFRAILMDTYTHETIGCRMTLDELGVVVPRLRGQCTGEHGGALNRLFDTYIGRLDLIGADDDEDDDDDDKDDEEDDDDKDDDDELNAGTRRFSLPSFFTSLSALAAFSNVLEELSITAPERWRSRSFDCRVVEDMGRLRSLTVHKFKDLDGMQRLPGSIRRLDVKFGQVFVPYLLSSHGISILDLPGHLQLEAVRVEKDGTVGLVARQLLEQCREVEVVCKYLLMAVSVVDEAERGIVSIFRNPFLEGRYVPPHVLADWDMIEASHRATDLTCSEFIEQLGSSDRSEGLRLLTIQEEANSIKVIPATPGDECESLRWVSSISEHQQQLLFGFSGEEFQARADLLLAAKARRGAECGHLRRVKIESIEEGTLPRTVIQILSD